jgi:hypothetical protein
MSDNQRVRFDEEEMDAFIEEAYEANFARLRLESGASLSPEVKQAGLEQVRMYWKVLREVALNVSETEVRLSLPQQETPKGSGFGIEGVVDIVEDEEKTVMYDIKTHDADYVQSHIDLYEDQLNVYAFIWQKLQEKRLDGTAVICTKLPDGLMEAIERGNEAMMAQEMAVWKPLIPIRFSNRKVEETIAAFGRVVDAIEDGKFAPPAVETLKEPYAQGHAKRFATHVCRNCDARFSCESYRKYARGGKGQIEKQFTQFFADLEASEPLESWRSAGLEAMPADETLD